MRSSDIAPEWRRYTNLSSDINELSEIAGFYKDLLTLTQLNSDYGKEN